MSPIFFPKRRVVAINAAGGALVGIKPTIPCRKMEIVECPPGGGSWTGANASFQGLNYTLADDGYLAIIPQLPGDTIRLGDDVSFGAGTGRALGWPVRQDPTGTTITPPDLIRLVSASASATQVEVREWA